MFCDDRVNKQAKERKRETKERVEKHVWRVHQFQPLPTTESIRQSRVSSYGIISKSQHSLLGPTTNILILAGEDKKEGKDGDDNNDDDDDAAPSSSRNAGSFYLDGDESATGDIASRKGGSGMGWDGPLSVLPSFFPHTFG